MAALQFLEARIDLSVSPGMSSTPTVPGRTKRYSSVGGLTQNYTAAYPIHKYDLAHGVKTIQQYQAILDLWYVVHFTPYSGFLLRDWRDYTLAQTNTRLTLITTGVYQINRLHSFGGVDFLRPIYKPEAGVVVKRTRAGVVSTATATVSTTTGQATISGHVGGDTYTCEGFFNVPVTFTDDEWSADVIRAASSLLSVGGSINLEEIRLEFEAET